MVNPMQAFDQYGSPAALQQAAQMGQQRGALSSPFTSTGNALDGVLQKYETQIAEARGLAGKKDLALYQHKLENPGMYDSATGGQKAPGSYNDTSELVTMWDPTTEKYFYTTKKNSGKTGTSTMGAFAPASPMSPTDRLIQDALGGASWGQGGQGGQGVDPELVEFSNGMNNTVAEFMKYQNGGK